MMWFLTTLGFVVLFYVIPLSHVIHVATARWQILPISVRQFELLGLGFNLPYVLIMVALYIACHLLIRWLLLMTEVVDNRLIHRLNELISVKGLRRFNRGVIALIVITVGVGFLYNVYAFGLGSLLSRFADYFLGEPLFFLCTILFVGFADNLIGGLPVARPKPRVPYQPDVEPEDEDAEGDDDEEVRVYRWTYSDQPDMPGAQPKEYAIRLSLNRKRYDRLRAEPRLVDVMKWDKYVREASPEVLRLAARFREIRDQEDWPPYNEIENLLTFAQSLEYQRDLTSEGESSDWPKYPLETLWEGGGDCEDSSILAAALLLTLGYDVALLFLPSHAALGIAGAEGLPGTFLEVKGRRYYYYETTGTGWEFGELPEHYQGVDFRVLPIRAEELPLGE